MRLWVVYASSFHRRFLYYFIKKTALWHNIFSSTVCRLFPFSYLLIDLRKLWIKIFGLISSLAVCLKNLHLVKNFLFIPNLCKFSTKHIILYPLICYFLPDFFCLLFEVWVHIMTSILSYNTLKSLCKKELQVLEFIREIDFKISLSVIFYYDYFISFSKCILKKYIPVKNK